MAKVFLKRERKKIKSYTLRQRYSFKKACVEFLVHVSCSGEGRRVSLQGVDVCRGSGGGQGGP